MRRNNRSTTIGGLSHLMMTVRVKKYSVLELSKKKEIIDAISAMKNTIIFSKLKRDNDTRCLMDIGTMYCISRPDRELSWPRKIQQNQMTQQAMLI